MTPTMLTDFSATSLNKWLQPQHLTPEAIGDAARCFAARPERYVVLDNFLALDRLELIRRVLLSDGELETIYRINDVVGSVDRKIFNATPDENRFIYEKIYRGPSPGKEMAPSVLSDLLFRRELGGDAFLSWLAASTGRKVSRAGKINLKWLDRSHFLRWHHDRVESRTVCMVLYLHEHWRPDFAGRFLMRRFDGGVDIVEPLCNRLILFDPQVGAYHAVEPITEAAGDWPRLNYTAWFYA